jgi:hypothetical protein
MARKVKKANKKIQTKKVANRKVKKISRAPAKKTKKPAR